MIIAVYFNFNLMVEVLDNGRLIEENEGTEVAEFDLKDESNRLRLLWLKPTEVCFCLNRNYKQ